MPKPVGQRQRAVSQQEPPINNIQCDGEVVPVADLVPDPNNARLHGERNLDAIKESLQRYGQREPLVVRSQDRMIAAGNGRRQAMLEMGWTHCAVTMRPMTDSEFIGFALADNRTAELAEWDYETVARLDQLLTEEGEQIVGWTKGELELLRLGDRSIGSEPGMSSMVDMTCPECGLEMTIKNPSEGSLQRGEQTFKKVV